ncbi:hypothetical protein KY331_06075 [Candidatus Woesearchaeota archaeon]|nr:hypothetical protein [Candidatus Woesearchaeota archaeon]
MWLRNLWGDAMGYSRCPITGDTLHSGYAFVRFKSETGLLVSEKALNLKLDDLAKAVYYVATRQGKADKVDTSPLRIRQKNDFDNLRVKRPRLFQGAGREFAAELSYGIEYNTLAQFLEEAADYAVVNGKKTERNRLSSFVVDSANISTIEGDVSIKVTDDIITGCALPSPYACSQYYWYVNAWRFLEISLDEEVTIEAKRKQGTQSWIIDKAESLDEVMSQLEQVLEKERERKQIQELMKS